MILLDSMVLFLVLEYSQDTYSAKFELSFIDIVRKGGEKDVLQR